METIIQKINQLKTQKKAIILAHIYQLPEVQDIADFVGDSLGLAQRAAQTDAEMIVFCGVQFMAETAHILSPKKKVILPDLKAGCPMADMVTIKQVLKMKEKYPMATVVSYVNTNADVKAVTDICCTSSNAVRVIKSIENNQILFFPDKNLGNWLKKQVPEKEIIPWNGFCITHERLREKDILTIKEEYPKALFAAHPECNESVLKYADFIGSTTQIVGYITSSKENEFILGTEIGTLHQILKKTPEKKVYPVDKYALVCQNMKKTTLEKILKQMDSEENVISLSKEIREKAYNSISRMISIT